MCHQYSALEWLAKDCCASGKRELSSLDAQAEKRKQAGAGANKRQMVDFSDVRREQAWQGKL